MSRANAVKALSSPHFLKKPTASLLQQESQKYNHLNNNNNTHTFYYQKKIETYINTKQW